MKKDIKYKNGQVLFMFAFLILAIYVFINLVVNISKLSVARIKLQKAADAAALAIATYQARCFNAIADKNFILKYPSGNKDKSFDKADTDSYSIPGLDQVDMATGFEFREGDFEQYLRLIAPHQQQQNTFIEVYQKMIPIVATTYVVKNDKDATVNYTNMTNFKFKRESVKVKIINVTKSLFNKYDLREGIDAYMTHPSGYMYGMVSVSKNVNIWNHSFHMEAIGLGELVTNKGSLWPDPKPNYKARLAQTQEHGVLH